MMMKMQFFAYDVMFDKIKCLHIKKKKFTLLLITSFCYCYWWCCFCCLYYLFINSLEKILQFLFIVQIALTIIMREIMEAA